MKERFLPIGTVVLLKNGKKEVMITSYCIFPNNVELKNGKEVKPEKKIYEYGGCIYPEGILDSNTVCAVPPIANLIAPPVSSPISKYKTPLSDASTT